MTLIEKTVKTLCEALVRVMGGDVDAYRARVEAMRGLTEDQQLEQVERRIRFMRRQRSAHHSPTEKSDEHGHPTASR
jgi:hypothetical protein